MEKIRVEGQSMSPFLQPGDELEMNWDLAPGELFTGDLILARESDSSWIVHRVITQKQEVLIAQGDAAFAKDEFLPNQIWGKVKAIEGRPFRVRRLDRWIAQLNESPLPQSTLHARITRKFRSFLGSLRRRQLFRESLPYTQEALNYFQNALHPLTQKSLSAPDCNIGSNAASTAASTAGSPVPIPSSESDWQFLMEYSKKVHAALPFFVVLERRGLLSQLPLSSRENIETELRKNRMRLALLDEELMFSLEKLTQAKIPCVALKGMDLGRRLYPARAFRPMTDVDLLVAESDFLRAIHTLEKAGYQKVGPFPKGRIRLELGRFGTHPSEGPVVELHQALQVEAPPEQTRQIWNRCQAGQIPGVPESLRCLATEDLIPYLVSHAGVQHLIESPVWLNDLHYAVNSAGYRATDPGFETRWVAVLKKLVQARLTPAAWFLFFYLNENLQSEIPEFILARLQARLSPWKTFILRRAAQPGRLFPPEGRPIYWTVGMRLLLREGWQGLLGYAFRYALGYADWRPKVIGFCAGSSSRASSSRKRRRSTRPR